MARGRGEGGPLLPCVLQFTYQWVLHRVLPCLPLQGLSFDLKGLAACLSLLPRGALLGTDAFDEEEEEEEEGEGAGEQRQQQDIETQQPAGVQAAPVGSSQAFAAGQRPGSQAQQQQQQEGAAPGGMPGDLSAPSAAHSSSAAAVEAQLDPMGKPAVPEAARTSAVAAAAPGPTAAGAPAAPGPTAAGVAAARPRQVGVPGQHVQAAAAAAAPAPAIQLQRQQQQGQGQEEDELDFLLGLSDVPGPQLLQQQQPLSAGISSSGPVAPPQTALPPRPQHGGTGGPLTRGVPSAGVSQVAPAPAPKEQSLDEWLDSL